MSGKAPTIEEWKDLAHRQDLRLQRMAALLVEAQPLLTLGAEGRQLSLRIDAELKGKR